MLSNETSNEENKLKTNRIFNIAEGPIMDFIAQFLEETPNVIFKCDTPEYVEPLILLPFDGYKSDTCIKFTIKPVNLSEYPLSSDLSIDSVIHHEKVKEGIGFLWYCIKEVYGAVVDSSMINKKPMENVSMMLNESNWMFYPNYSHELSVKKNFLDESHGKLMYINENLSKFPTTMANEITEAIVNVNSQLAEINSQITPEIIDAEKLINISYCDKVVLGIFIEEIHVSELPKPILSQEDDQKNNKTISENTSESSDIGNNVESLFDNLSI
jgi:hypothetical protein